MLVLDDTAFSEARLLHPHNEGFFTVAQKHAPNANGKVWSERGYAMSSLEQVLGAVQSIPDYYISQASFVTRRRGNATVKSVNCSFIDLDCYNLGITADESTVEAILVQSAACGLPLPSYVMSSGRGLYCKWIFDQPLSGALVPHWQKLQAVLCHLFLAFGSDSNARDLARVLRASSTRNSKNGQDVRVVYKSGLIHRFADLAAVAARISIPEIIETSNTAARKIRATQDSLIVIPSDLSALVEYGATREPVMLKQFSRQSLNWTRFMDLRDLMLMRNGAARGSRDVFLFWMAASLASSGVIDAVNFMPEVQNLLRGFPVSRDFDPVNDGSLESLRRRVAQHCSGQKVEFNGSRVSPIYTPGNDYLINVLNITDAEQMSMKTIISSQEKQRRADLKAPGRQERRVERSDARVMAVQLQRDGLSMTAIAGQIGVNKSTISRWLAPAEINKTREHERYKSQTWDAERIKQWLAKQEATLAERNRRYEQMREKEAHLLEAKKAQDKLKTSGHLMSIYRRIHAISAGENATQAHRQLAANPLEPADDQNDDSVEYERPRG